jgi:uncharacterized protein YccT (UPF0319 family)
MPGNSEFQVMPSIRFSGRYIRKSPPRYPSAQDRNLIEEYWAYDGSHRLSIETSVQVAEFDDREEMTNVLKEVLPSDLATQVMEYHHEWCHTLVFKRLAVAGWMHNFPKHHHKITVALFEKILRENMKIDYCVMNGPSIRRFKAEQSPERGEVGIHIHNENVTLCDGIANTYWQQYRSSWVHGIPLYTKGLEYVKVLEILLDHFKHDGAMKTEIIPARSDLNRTQYEVLMILIKHYAKTLIDKEVYWKIDKKRRNCVKEIIETIVEPKRKMMKVSGQILLPTVSETTNMVVRIPIYEEVPDPSEPHRASTISLFEREMMAAEDFDAGSVEGQEKLHMNVRTEIIPGKLTPAKPPKPLKGKFGAFKEEIARYDALVASEGYVKPPRKFAKMGKLSGRKILKMPEYKKIVEPKQKYFKYLDNSPHGISTTTGPIKVKLGVRTEVSKWQSKIDIRSQDKWQEEANINMAAVIDNSFKYNIAETKTVKTYRNNREDQKYRALLRRDKKAKFVRKIARNAGGLLRSSLRKSEVLMEKTAEYTERIKEAGLTQLQNKINMRSLYYSFYVLGQHKSIARMGHLDMTSLLVLFKHGRRFTPLGNKRHKDTGELKCTRVTKYDLKLLRSSMTAFRR